MAFSIYYVLGRYNDYWTYTFTYLMDRKSETFGKFMVFWVLAEKQLEKSLKNLDLIEEENILILNSRTTF